MLTIPLTLPLLLAFLTSAAPAEDPNHAIAPTRISDDGRLLLKPDGSPFFYLGDTAWELFHRLDRDQADRYLQDRARKGFTVIQAVAIAELDGHTTPNPYGHLPLVNLDPARPAVTDGPRNDYWDHVDFIVERANQLGLVVGFLPTWGRYWHDQVHEGRPLFDAQNAEAYGRWLGARYRDRAIIWILGGDRPIENDDQKELIRAMARGLADGDAGTHLMTFHPPGGSGSAQWFHQDDWLDFNMRQNGHVAEFTGRYDATRTDYDRSPPRPVIDGEPIYEDHPVSFNPDNLGHSIAADVRRPLYWDLFTGACGHTYGHHSVWQMWDADRPPINRPLLPWHQAIDQPGAAQMQHGRHLIESRPMHGRIPDDTIIVDEPVRTAVPGAGRYRLVATGDADHSYAFVYSPSGRPFSIHMNTIHGPRARAWWLDPRTGDAREIGEFDTTGTRRFHPPAPGEMLDWVLVLDDARRNYPPPGRTSP